MLSETAEARVIDDDSNIGGSDIKIIAVPINPLPIVEADAVSMHSFEVSVDDEVRTARLHTALALEVLRRRDNRYGGGGSAVSLVKISISLFFFIIVMIYLIM